MSTRFWLRKPLQTVSNPVFNGVATSLNNLLAVLGLVLVQGLKRHSWRLLWGGLLAGWVSGPLWAQAGEHITSVVPVTTGPIGRYEKFEVCLTLDRDFSQRVPGRNPFDPADVSVVATFTGPGGRTSQVRYGFYYQDFEIQDKYLATNDPRYWQPRPTPQPWRVRFAPDEAGTWRYVLRVTYGDSTTETSAAYAFECVASANPGFLRVAPNRRNLVFEQGQSFLAIGSNVDYWGSNPVRLPAGLPSPGPARASSCNGGIILTPLPSENQRFSTYTCLAYQQVFEDLNCVGGNFARVWMQEFNWDIETYDSTTQVNTLGYYQPHQPRMYDFDRMLESARTNGVYLHLSLLDGMRLWNVLEMHKWREFPYKVGLHLGPTEQRRFFTEPEARRLFRNKLRYIVARWGYSPHIASYELLNEGDFVNAGQLFCQNFRADFPPLWAWTVEMATYLKSIDTRHLQTAAYGAENAYEILRDNPDLFDYTTSHDYTASFNAELRRNYYVQAMTRLFHRPFQLQEIDYLPYISTRYETKFHSMPWATAFSGSLGIGLSLSAFANLHQPCYPAYQYYKPLARFLAATGFHSGAANEPIGNVATAAAALYGPDYLLALGEQPYPPLLTTAPPTANPAYFSACDRQCPPSWMQSVGIAPNFGPPLNEGSLQQNDQPDYLVQDISTSQDGLVEVYALRNARQIIGWVHNKTHYWYNLPHAIQVNHFCHNDSCAQNPGVTSNPDDAVSNTITPLRGQELVVRTTEESKELGPLTYRVRWFYTHPGRDADADGDPDNGGFLPKWEQPAVPVIDGTLRIAIPPLVALGSQGPNSAPDYAFCLTRNLPMVAPETDALPRKPATPTRFRPAPLRPKALRAAPRRPTTPKHRRVASPAFNG